jgi:hypothetical protein
MIFFFSDAAAGLKAEHREEKNTEHLIPLAMLARISAGEV